jgi:DNA-binding LacI/PurR family transcriptional regulator
MPHPAPHRQASAQQQLRRTLWQEIASGRWPVGERIPTLDLLEQRFRYSRMTISRAIRELAAQGLLETRGKAGTFVRCAPDGATLGILANFQSDSFSRQPFALTVTQLLETALLAAGQRVRVYPESAGFLDGTAGPCAALADDLRHQALAGLITVASNLPEWERRHPERRLHVPTVNISYHPARYRVYYDFAAAADAGLAALLAAGHRRLGMIGSPHPGMAPRFAERARAAGCEVRREWLHTHAVATIGEEYGFRALHRLWQSPERPTALFVPDDIAAKGVCQAALALGLRLPADLDLVYQANTGIDHFYPFPLRRIVLDLPALAAAAIGLVQQVIANPDLPPTERLIAPALPATAERSLAHVLPLAPA